jgi:hypothetical protein
LAFGAKRGEFGLELGYVMSRCGCIWAKEKWRFFRLSTGEQHLRHLIKDFVEHYMTERFHQGIGGQLIRNIGPTNDNGADSKVACRSRLGGVLNFYHREAA